MKTIRRNTFETNSSSVHCVTILSDKEYQNIKNGKAVLDYRNYVEITPQFIQEKLQKIKNILSLQLKNMKRILKSLKSLLM